MEIITKSSPSPVSRWWILFLVHSSVTSFALNLQMIPPLLPKLISETGLTHTGAGVLMGLFTLPGIFLAIPGGRAADILGGRSVTLWSLALLTAGAVLMVPLHHGFLYAGRLCSGIGGAVLVVAAPQIITRSFHGRELGLAMGFFNTAVPFGTILAFNFLGYLGGEFGIPVVFMATASLSFLSLAAFFLTYAEPRRQHTTGTGSKGTPISKGLGSGIWLVSLIWVLFNISILSYFTYAVDQFTGSGMGSADARFMTSLPMLLSIFLTPVAGVIMHRYGLRWSLIFAGCLLSAGAIYLVLAPDKIMILLWSILLGAGISIVPPAVFTLAGELVPPSRVGTGFGLLTSIFNLGVFIGIPLIGYARDLTLNYQASFIFMSIIMGSGAVVAMISPKLLSKR
jgi:MFS family permease